MARLKKLLMFINRMTTSIQLPRLFLNSFQTLPIYLWQSIFTVAVTHIHSVLRKDLYSNVSVSHCKWKLFKIALFLVLFLNYKTTLYNHHFITILVFFSEYQFDNQFLPLSVSGFSVRSRSSAHLIYQRLDYNRKSSFQPGELLPRARDGKN